MHLWPSFRLCHNRSLAGLLAAALLLAACSEPARPEFEFSAVVETRLAGARERARTAAPSNSAQAREALERLSAAPLAAQRAQAARDLRETDESWIVLDLLAQLSVERDEETRIEIACTLGRFRNWAGLDALYEVRSNGSTPLLRTAASIGLDALVVASGQETPEDLWRLWKHGDMDEELPQVQAGAQHEVRVWEYVGRLGEIANQDTDEAIFALSNSSAWVANHLAATLHEQHPIIRLNAMTCLERMGPRAVVAGPELVRMLGAPNTPRFDRPYAATALGKIGYPFAVGELVRCLDSQQKTGLRVAAAEALGDLGLPEAARHLESLLAKSENAHLRNAAATALIRMENSESAARTALELMRAEDEVAPYAEDALQLWIEARAEVGDEASRRALELWNEEVAPPGLEPTPEESALRRSQRAAAVEPLLHP